jgi:hypothetical protein
MKMYTYIEETYPDNFESFRNQTEQDIINALIAPQFQQNNGGADVAYYRSVIGKLEIAEEAIIGCGIIIRTR